VQPNPKHALTEIQSFAHHVTQTPTTLKMAITIPRNQLKVLNLQEKELLLVFKFFCYLMSKIFLLFDE